MHNQTLLTLALDKFNIADADVVLEEADDRQGDVVENFPYTLLDHLKNKTTYFLNYNF